MERIPLQILSEVAKSKYKESTPCVAAYINLYELELFPRVVRFQNISS